MGKRAQVRVYTRNNIGSFEGTLLYYYHATPGVLLGLHGDSTEEPILFRVIHTCMHIRVSIYVYTWARHVRKCTPQQPRDIDPPLVHCPVFAGIPAWVRQSSCVCIILCV